MTPPCPGCLDHIADPGISHYCTCDHKVGCQLCGDYEDCDCELLINKTCRALDNGWRLDDGTPCCGYRDACDPCARRIASITLDGPPRTIEELRIAARLQPLITTLEDDL